MIRDEINLDLLKKTSQCVVTTKQGELDRQVSISFREGRKPYMIPDGVTAVFSARTSDGATLYNDCTVDKNKVIYDFTEGTTAAVGAYDAEIILYNGDTPLVSATFSIQVDQRASNAKKITSSDEFKQLDKMLEEGSALYKDTQKLVIDVSENTGSSIKKTASGKTLLLTDVSPITHVMKVKVTPEDAIPSPYVVGSQTVNGVAFTDNGDNSITLNGEATETAFHIFQTDITLPKGSYILSGCPEGGSPTGYMMMLYNNVVNQSDAGSGRSFTLEEDTYYQRIYIRVEKGTVVNNVTFTPKILPDLTKAKIHRYGSNHAKETYSINADGTVDGVKSLYPTTTLIPDMEYLTIDAVYNIGTQEYVRDNEKAVEEALINADLPLSADILKRIYAFKYYSTLPEALSDTNSVNEDLGNVGCYTDGNGTKSYIILNDIKSAKAVTVDHDCNINLNGKVLSFATGTRLNIDNNANVTIDGRIHGSKIEKTLDSETSVVEHLIYVNSGKLTVYGGTYVNDIAVGGKSPYVFFVYNGATLDLEGVALDITLRGGHATPYGIRNRGTLHCNNSLIRVDTYDNAVDATDFPSAYGIMNDGTGGKAEAVISYTKIVCDGMRGDIGTGMYLGENTKTEVYECEVYGVFGGINCVGEVVIKGGKYYGIAHGGLYCGNENGITYVENAIIGSARYSGKHKQIFDYKEYHDVTGFYVGTKSNTSVYFDNCEILGGKTNLFILRGSSGEQNNAVCFSNCNISGKTNHIRIDNNTLKAYFGFGNNITAEDVEADIPECVIDTNEIYIKKG